MAKTKHIVKASELPWASLAGHGAVLNKSSVIVVPQKVRDLGHIQHSKNVNLIAL